MGTGLKDFTGKLAVITGGGSGIGRALARQLAAEGCSVATCDILEDNLAETAKLCQGEAAQGCAVSTHRCDVAIEDEVLAFREAVKAAHDTDHIDLLFNNAGVGGGSSFVDGDREEWERTFNICWFGVYYSARAFMPMLLASADAHMVNISSVNGFWATLGPGSTHSAYSAAKFAVKGFTEALVTDFANNAPHVKVSVVMPGHIGTSIAINARRIIRGDEITAESLDRARARYEALGLLDKSASDEQVRQVLDGIGEWFRQSAPTTAEQAASIILGGVREERWRILVGDDARHLDEMVRAAPEDAYTDEFLAKLRQRSQWSLG